VSNPLKKPENTIENIPTRIDRAVFPGMQGGPHMNTIAAIAVALHETQTAEFKTYAEQALKNAQVLASELTARGYTLVTG
jgi:glycine hydroxymethyltransferase